MTLDKDLARSILVAANSATQDGIGQEVRAFKAHRPVAAAIRRDA
jgi:hypothetical protein